MTTLNEICTDVDILRKYRIVSIEQTKKRTTAIVSCSNGSQKEVAIETAHTLHGFYGIVVQPFDKVPV